MLFGGGVEEDEISSGSESESWKDAVIRKKCTWSSVSAVTGNSQVADGGSRPKIQGDHRDDDGRSEEELEAEELDAAKLFSLLYTICDNVNKNTRCPKQLQQATRHSRCVCDFYFFLILCLFLLCVRGDFLICVTLLEGCVDV